MRLLLFNNAINERGGAERVMLKIAQHYDAKIYVHLYDPDATFPEFKDTDINVIGKRSSHRKGKAASAIIYGTSFYSMKLREDYDLINAHMSPSEWIRNKNPHVLWYCHTPPRIIYDEEISAIKRRSPAKRIAYAPLALVYKMVENRIASKIEGIAANSMNTHDRLKRYLGLESKVINPSIDARGFRDRGDDRYFLYPSRIAEEKRQDYAIRAFRRFSEMSKKRYKLIIAGSLSKRHAEFSEYYERIRHSAGRDVSFVINPDDDEMKELYSRCTAVLYPPINEDFGIVPLEAMASRKPVIALDEGGPRETIREKETGFLVRSEESMAKHMLHITKNESEADRMGRNGRKLVEKEYTWGAFFKKFDALAKKVSE